MVYHLTSPQPFLNPLHQPAPLVSCSHILVTRCVGAPLWSLFLMAFGIWHELGQIIKFHPSPQTNSPWTRSPPSPVCHACSAKKSNCNSVKLPTGKRRMSRCVPHCCATHSTARGLYETRRRPSNQLATVVQTTQEEA